MATTMKSMQSKVRTGWAVRNRTGQVVVIYEGQDALAAAKEWAESRGFAVEAVTLD
jgi:hypothetical protein